MMPVVCLTGCDMLLSLFMHALDIWGDTFESMTEMRGLKPVPSGRF